MLLQCICSVGFVENWMLRRGRNVTLVDWSALRTPAWGFSARGASESCSDGGDAAR